MARHKAATAAPNFIHVIQTSSVVPARNLNLIARAGQCWTQELSICPLPLGNIRLWQRFESHALRFCTRFSGLGDPSSTAATACWAFVCRTQYPPRPNIRCNALRRQPKQPYATSYCRRGAAAWCQRMANGRLSHPFPRSLMPAPGRDRRGKAMIGLQWRWSISRHFPAPRFPVPRILVLLRPSQAGDAWL
jgi:hypothetical protein